MLQKSVSKKIRNNCGYNLSLSNDQCCAVCIALKKFSTLIMSVFVIALITSCKHHIPGITDNGESNPPATSTCSPDTVYFQQQVLPVLVSNCAMIGCHDNASHQEGIVLTSYSGIMSAGIRAGNPYSSRIYKKIIEPNPGDRMPPPPRNPLTQAQIDLINKWITQGARNNSCLNASCDTANVTYSISIRSIISNKCQGCHSSSSAGGGYDFTTYSGVKARIDDGKLWGSVNYMPGYSPMPKNGTKLSTCELAKIKKWIDAGAANN
jgi:mono/diheme cytochrome c family protein